MTNASKKLKVDVLEFLKLMADLFWSCTSLSQVKAQATVGQIFLCYCPKGHHKPSHNRLFILCFPNIICTTYINLPHCVEARAFKLS